MFIVSDAAPWLRRREPLRVRLARSVRGRLAGQYALGRVRAHLDAQDEYARARGWSIEVGPRESRRYRDPRWDLVKAAGGVEAFWQAQAAAQAAVAAEAAAVAS